MEKTNYYFDRSGWEVNTEGRGTEINPFVAMAIAIALGGIFVVFMPFIGLTLVAQALVVRIAAAVKPHAGPVPVALGASYLTGSPSEEGQSDELSDLQEEVSKARINKE